MSQPQPDPSSSPPPFVVEPTSAHTHSFIILHGMGSNGEKFGRELLETGVTSDGQTLTQLMPNTRFIFPTARRRRASAFGRAMLTIWFDKACLSDPSVHKERQIRGLGESALEILELLRQEQEISKIPSSNVVLGGLSQGCAISISVLLSLHYAVGGFVGMSGYLPFREDIDEAVTEDVMDEDDDPFSRGGDEEGEEQQQDPAVVKASIFERDLLGLPALEKPGLESTAHSTPIFIGHGSADDRVPCSLSEDMAATLEKAGYKVKLKLYNDLGHWYKIPDEIDDIVEFLRSVVGWKV